MQLTVTWLCREEALLISLSDDQMERRTLIADSGACDSTEFFGRVAEALADAGKILILGPDRTRTELFQYLNAHAPTLAQRVVGCEPLNDCSDGQVAAQALRYFQRANSA